MMRREIGVSYTPTEVRDALGINELVYNEIKGFAGIVHNLILKEQPLSDWCNYRKTWTELPSGERQAAVDMLTNLCRKYGVLNVDNPDIDVQGGLTNRLAETRRNWYMLQRQRQGSTMPYDPVRDS